MSSSNKKTFISFFDFNITIWTLNKQHKSQSNPDDNINIIKIFISKFSSHHTEIPITYPKLHISMITKDHFHQQSLLKFSQKQLKDDPIQPKLNIIINQIDDHLAADFYELVTAWQQARMQSNTQLAQLTANLKKTQQHWDKYQKAY